MEFLPFFLILIVGVIISGLFTKFHLPWVLALIVTGIAIGPQGASFISVDPTLEFIGQVGLIFLMFMAGLGTKLSGIQENAREVSMMALINAAVPFAVGFGIGAWFDFSLTASLLLGIIFMSSSIAVVVPTLESLGILNHKLGRSIVSTTMVEDIASLALLSILLQSVDPITSLPLPSFYGLLFFALIALRYGLPRIRELIPHRRDATDLFESEVRIIFALLLGTVVIFELLGLHPIIAGFFAGLVLSDSIKSDILLDKLHTLSYGVFVPVFFVVVGAETDISVFFGGTAALGLVSVVVIGSILAKFISGWFAAHFTGFSNKDAVTFGIATIPQLSTTLAVVFTAVELELVPSELATAMVILSIVTTFLAPLVLRRLYDTSSTA